MKKFLLIPAVAGALLLAACGPKNDSAAATPAPAGNTAAANSFDFTANDTMKYNMDHIEVKAGADITVTLTNMGNMPKTAMAHNWILLKKGTDPKAFVDSAITAAATDYIPAATSDQIIIHTKLLGPKQSDELKFKAPTEPGEYPFVCSFPAHYLSGMHGVMVVK